MSCHIYNSVFLSFFILRTLNVFGDIISDFIESMGRNHLNGWLHHFTQRTIVIIIGSVIVLPRCFSASMSRLWVNSLVSLIALLLAMVALFFVFLTERHADEEIHPLVVTGKWWLTPGIVLFAVAHQQVSNDSYRVLMSTP
jgi:amino acid permease